MASARAELALHRRDGSLFRDREGLAWTDPNSRVVWDCNIAVATEAAQAAIDGFLEAARKALTPFNVFLAVDIFGYVCWNEDDTKIGQKLEHLVGIVDYISPMLYPSSFQFGIPGYRDPVQPIFLIGDMGRLQLQILGGNRDATGPSFGNGDGRSKTQPLARSSEIA